MAPEVGVLHFLSLQGPGMSITSLLVLVLGTGRSSCPHHSHPSLCMEGRGGQVACKQEAWVGTVVPHRFQLPELGPPGPALIAHRVN